MLSLINSNPIFARTCFQLPRYISSTSAPVNEKIQQQRIRAMRATMHETTREMERKLAASKDEMDRNMKSVRDTAEAEAEAAGAITLLLSPLLISPLLASYNLIHPLIIHTPLATCLHLSPSVITLLFSPRITSSFLL